MTIAVGEHIIKTFLSKVFVIFGFKTLYLLKTNIPINKNNIKKIAMTWFI